MTSSYVDRAEDAASAYPKVPQARNSIAVLPFVNLSDNPENDYFCDGISEELIGLLAKAHPLKVVARTSSFEFKDKGSDVRRIAEQPGVENVLEGSVRLAGNHIRVSAQLIDASTGYHLWADTFDTRFEDVFTVQDQIASAIVKALKVSLDADDGVPGITDRTAPTADMAAYRSYLQGLARELDPVSPVINDRLGVTYLWSGEYELAAEQFRIASELGFNRISYNQAYILLLLHNGKIDEAVTLYETILGKLGLDTGWVRPVAEATRDPARAPGALEAVAQAQAHGTLPDAMAFYAAVLLKQPDLAFATAENLLEDRSLTVEFLFSPQAEELRHDSRFPPLLAKIGLDAYWDQHGWPTFCKPQSGAVVCN